VLAAVNACPSFLGEPMNSQLIPMTTRSTVRDLPQDEVK
jgi:hypothetical protein